MRVFRSIEEVRAAGNLEPGWRLALERVMGDLTSAYANAGYYWRKKWEDGKAQRVERCLNKFFIDVHYFIESRAKEWKRRDEERRVREEAKQRREKLIQMQKEERARIAKLEEESALWRKSEDIRGYVEAFRRVTGANGAPVTPDSEAGQWISWALAQADRLDPLVPSPPSVLDEKVDPYGY